MKKVISLVLTLCLLMMTAAFGIAETADGSAEALELMENIKGTYEPLFPVITAPESGNRETALLSQRCSRDREREKTFRSSVHRTGGADPQA